MGLLERTGVLDRYKVSPTQGTSGLFTGQPALSPFAQQAARNIGGALGMDMRTPEEKILAATAGIDRTTAALTGRAVTENSPDTYPSSGRGAYGALGSQ